MIAAVVLAWTAVIIVLDVVVVRPWKTVEARTPLPWILGALAGGWVLVLGAQTLSNLQSRGMWTAATVAIAFVPLKATVYSLIAYAGGRTLLIAHKSRDRRRWSAPVLLAAMLASFIAIDVHTRLDQTRERHAESTTLSQAEVAALAERVRSGTAGDSEMHAFLANPLCPPEVLAALATSPQVGFRSDVARNPKLPPALAETLSHDQSEIVRYYLTFNRDLPADLLERLRNDPDPQVRNAANRRY